jgi:prepilin peptidase CpaA
MNAVPVVTAGLILGAGVLDDLRSRKFHNWLFLAASGLAFTVAVVTGGLTGLNFAFLGFVAGFIALLPLVILHVIGAGDMKLMAALGAVIGWSAGLDVVMYSLIWGALFGVFQVIMKGQLKTTLQNMLSIARIGANKAAPTTPVQLHQMPFTFAILMGWLTFVVRTGAHL